MLCVQGSRSRSRAPRKHSRSPPLTMRPPPQALLGVIASLVAATLNGYGPNLNQGRQWGVGWIQDSSFARWANEAWFHA